MSPLSSEQRHPFCFVIYCLGPSSLVSNSKVQMHQKGKTSSSFLETLHLGDNFDFQNDVEVFLSCIYVVISLRGYEGV